MQTGRKSKAMEQDLIFQNIWKQVNWLIERNLVSLLGFGWWRGTNVAKYNILQPCLVDIYHQTKMYLLGKKLEKYLGKCLNDQQPQAGVFYLSG